MTQVERTLEALRQVCFPGLDRDIVTLGYVKDIQEVEGRSIIKLEMSTNLPDAAKAIEQSARAALERSGIPHELHVELPVLQPHPAHTPEQPRLLTGIPFKIAVASGKGGVGKSTVAVNLALALSQLGSKVGLLDCDIYGPSVPMMMGMGQDRPRMEGEMMVPIERYDVRTISIGSLIERDTPIIWRGPMASKALDQFMSEVNWTGVETLVLDLPPGTGDIQITLSQRVSLTGAVIVTTPQDVALVDAAKGVGMFRKVQVPVLGMIENMSVFVCPHCGQETKIFGPGGAEKEAARLGVQLLGSIPIDPRIVTGGDAGTPIVRQIPDSPAAVAFLRVAERIRESLR